LRVDDNRFVLDELARLADGRGPGQQAFPRGLARSMDLERVGMLGHSLGNPATAQTMLTDERIDAGAGLDGSLRGSVVTQGLDRPYLLLSTTKHRLEVDQEGWAEFWSNLRGRRLHLVVLGTLHLDFSDFAVFKDQVDLTAVLPGLLGPIPGARALGVDRAYIAAWFDDTLRDQPQALLDGPSPRFPEVEFQPR
jgi:predicted dienelactone hydrolase